MIARCLFTIVASLMIFEVAHGASVEESVKELERIYKGCLAKDRYGDISAVLEKNVLAVGYTNASLGSKIKQKYWIQIDQVDRVGTAVGEASGISLTCRSRGCATTEMQMEGFDSPIKRAGDILILPSCRGGDNSDLIVTLREMVVK